MKLYGTRRLFGKPEPVFSFDPDLAVFAPGMAKRAGTVFAAAPIVQGKWDGSGTPDVLSLARGNDLMPVGDWYDRFDPYQGSIVFWITPEWDGNDGIRHFIFRLNASYYAEKHSGNNLRFVVGGQIHQSVDASGWTAGTTYCLVCRWDINNVLDGTNYLCVSVNDAHSFGISTSPTGAAPDATIYIGTNATPALGTDAIIEGLTIYRRPLFDGAYGVDVGNGDEINLITFG